MTRKMSRLQIIGLMDDLLATIRMLGEVGCMHIDRVSDMPELALSPLTVDAQMVREQEELNLMLLQVKGMMEILGLNNVAHPSRLPAQADCEALLPDVMRLVPRVQALANRREKLRAEQELLPRFLDTMRKLLPLFPAVARDPGYVSFGLLVERHHTDVLDIVAGHIAEITNNSAETAVGAVDAATQAMLIAAPKPFADAIAAMLDRQDVSRLRLPSGFDSDSPEVAIAALQRRLSAIPDECARIDLELREVAEQEAGNLLAWRMVLQDRLETYTILPLLGQTEMTFVLVGWVPAADVTRLKAALRHDGTEKLVVTELPVSEDVRRLAPVCLTNPRIAQPFESLVHLFSTPSYEGLDPTRLMAFFMPLFFGMMLGDIGYGALLLGLTWWLRRRYEGGVLHDVLTILAFGSAWAVAFGFVYGEFLGTLGEELGLHPIWFDRVGSEHVLDVLALALAAGAVHMLLGLGLGIWEGIREKSRHHLLERGGRLLGLIAMFLLVGVLTDVLPDGFMTPAIASLVLGTVLLAWSLGKIGVLVAPIEMLSLVGNMLSYLRIAAIGLSSVYLALVASELAGVVGSIVVGILIAVLLHALNIALGAFSPTIQSLRLHYVEFFRNFYTGGGRRYEPFQLRLPQRERKMP